MCTSDGWFLQHSAPRTAIDIRCVISGHEAYKRTRRISYACWWKQPCKWKKTTGETQTLRTGCSKAEPKIFSPPQIPFPGAQDGRNLISWRLLPTNPVWWGSMHAISSYHGNRPTNKHTHRDRTDYNTLRAKFSVQCNNCNNAVILTSRETCVCWSVMFGIPGQCNRLLASSWSSRIRRVRCQTNHTQLVEWRWTSRNVTR